MISGRTSKETLTERLKADASTLKDFKTLTGFAAAVAAGVPLDFAAYVALVLEAAGAGIAAGARLFDGAREDVARPRDSSSYDRFRVIFYVAAQKAYLEALDARIRQLKLSAANTPSGDDSKKAKEKLGKALSSRIAQLDEAEVRFHFSVDPTDRTIPLYQAYSDWLDTALQALPLAVTERMQVVRQIHEEAKSRFRSALATDDPVSRWMRDYLALAAQEDRTRVIQDLSAMREILEGWTSKADEQHRQRWADYKNMLRNLPDKPETMFDESFGVSKVFVAPVVTYHRAALSGGDDRADVVPDVARLFGALLSDRASGADLIILSGGPGSGKSTLCRILASELARNDDVHPVFLRLRRYKEGADFGSYIAEQLIALGVISRFADLQNVPNVVLILDGFDELVMASRARLRHFFNVLQEDLSLGPLRHAKAIVSGRDTLFPKGEGLPRNSHVITLQAFDKRRVAAWGAKWRRVNAHANAKSFKPEQFVDTDANKKQSALHHLVTWPLTLHLVARVHTAGKLNITGAKKSDLEKAFLYRSILSETATRQSEQTAGQDRLDAKAMREFVRLLAWEMYARSVDSLDPEDVKPLVSQFYPGSGETLLAELSDVAVVNAPEFKRAEDTGFEFVHKSFAEYLVAEKLARVVEEVTYQVTDLDGASAWRKDLREASRSCAAFLGIRVVTAELQEMVEPMLGAYTLFRDGALRDANFVETRKRGLQRILTRFGDLFSDFACGAALATVTEPAVLLSLMGIFRRTPIMVSGWLSSARQRRASCSAKPATRTLFSQRNRLTVRSGVGFQRS